ncbi:MAG: hemolysin III family protein [Bdellovibrio sp.]
MSFKIAIQDGEKFNTFSHLMGAFFATCGAALLMRSAVLSHDSEKIFTCFIYCFSTVLIYVISTLYHSSNGPKKDVFRRLDYIGIYLKIAGNYTPFMILAIRGLPGYSVLMVVWAIAAVGVMIEAFFKPENRLVPNLLYLSMCATVIPVLSKLFAAVHPLGFFLIMLGFASYGVGFLFFLNDEKIKHGHGIWHMFVIAGTAAQYFCLLMYVV